MRPPISSADLIRAYNALKPSTPNQKSAIARVLGWDLGPSGKPRPQREKPPVSREESKPEVSLPREVPVKSRQISIDPTPVPTDSFTIEGPLPRRGVELLTMTAEDFETPAAPAAPRQPDTLFVPRQARAIITTALAARSPNGPLDIDAIVETIARGNLLPEVPRLPVPAMALRVDLLIDVGESMLPFADDQRAMISLVRSVAGVEGVRVLKFIGSPLRDVGDDSMPEWREYRY